MRAAIFFSRRSSCSSRPRVVFWRNFHLYLESIGLFIRSTTTVVMRSELRQLQNYGFYRDGKTFYATNNQTYLSLLYPKNTTIRTAVNVQPGALLASQRGQITCTVTKYCIPSFVSVVEDQLSLLVPVPLVVRYSGPRSPGRNGLPTGGYCSALTLASNAWTADFVKPCYTSLDI